MPLRVPAHYWIALGVLLIAPGAVAAQPSDPQEPVVSTSPEATGAALITPARALNTEQQAAPPQAERRRRRPSMVGYVEDATVTSQLRFRFDAGFGNDVPDRAEFFYAKCGCYVFDPPPARDLDAPGPGPGVPSELNFQQFYAYIEKAFTPRLSVFGELPFRAIQPQGFLDFGPPYFPWDDMSGIGDVRFGIKASLFENGDTGVTALVRMSAPSGDAAKGLGTNNASIEPSLLFHARAGEKVGLEGQFGYWHMFGGSAGVDSPDSFSGDVITYGIGPSFDLVDTGSMRFSPVIELVGWHIVNGFQTKCDGVTFECVFDASGLNIFNVKLGGRAAFGDRHSIYAGFGWALTDEVWYEKLFRFEYRLGF